MALCLPPSDIRLQHSWADLPFWKGQVHLRKHLLSVRSCFFPKGLFSHYKIIFLLDRRTISYLSRKKKTPNNSVVPWCLAIRTTSRESVWFELVLPAQRKVTCSSFLWKKISANIEHNALLTAWARTVMEEFKYMGLVTGFVIFPFLCHHSQGKNIKNNGVFHIEIQRKYHPVSSFRCVRESVTYISFPICCWGILCV